MNAFQHPEGTPLEMMLAERIGRSAENHPDRQPSKN